MLNSSLIKSLKRWAGPTVERYRLHIEACNELGVESEPFEKFAEEVLNTPEPNRDWLLTVEPLANVEPFMRFAQYESPRVEEMSLGLSGRGKR